MPELNRLFDRLARRVGGARVLALPLIRTLALLAAVAWLVLAPREYRQSAPLVAAVIGFFAYSLAVEASLWWRPAATLRLNFYVLLVDQAFALVLIYLTGGARRSGATPSRALPRCRPLLQRARDGGAVDQGGQSRDALDAPLLPPLPRE